MSRSLPLWNGIINDDFSVPWIFIWICLGNVKFLFALVSTLNLIMDAHTTRKVYDIIDNFWKNNYLIRRRP